MPVTTSIRSMTIPSKRSIVSLLSSWVLMIPLLVFASQWGFSFEHGAQNTEVGARSNGTENSTPLKIQSAVVYLTCAFFIMKFGRAILFDLYSDLLITSLPALAFLSIIWSQFPLSTLVHAMMLAANVAFAFYLMEGFSTNDLLKLMLMVGALAGIGSLLLIVLFPRFGIQARSSITAGAWQGIFSQKNILGMVMTDLLLPAFFVEIKSHYAKILRNGYIIMMLSLIAMSRSAGAWVICASCIVFIAATRILVQMPRKDLWTIAFILAGFTTAAGILVYNNFDALTYAIGKDPTLTGRTFIWSSVLSSIEKRPILGFGYRAFWAFLQGESANTVLLFKGPLAYAENGVLELALDLGAAGVCLYVLIFLRAVKDAIYCYLRKPTPGAMWYATILFYIAVSNIEAGKLLSTSDLGLILSVVAFVGLRREAQRARLKQKQRQPEQYLDLDGALALSGVRW